MSRKPSIPTDPAELRAWRDRTLYRLLLRASEAERRATLGGIHRRGHLDVTMTDTALLANLDNAGTTISALARRSGITRQAASQQVALLEREGYVSRAPDPRDARAWLVLRTAKGHELLSHALETVRDIEADYTTVLGAERTALLRELLEELVAYSDPGGSLGRD